LLSAEFLAVAQVMVYIGGIVVFIVFTILLTCSLGERSLEIGTLRKVIAVVFSVAVAVLAVLLLKNAHGIAQMPNEHFASLAEIGKRLLAADSNGFLLPFEAISLLLLISLIGAVTIARTIREDKNAGDEK
jgi:NADH-quinone oxidoreductase subunit J